MFSQKEQLKELTMSVKCEEKRNKFMSNTNRKNSSCQLLGVIVCGGNKLVKWINEAWQNTKLLLKYIKVTRRIKVKCSVITIVERKGNFFKINPKKKVNKKQKRK